MDGDSVVVGQERANEILSMVTYMGIQLGTGIVWGTERLPLIKNGTMAAFLHAPSPPPQAISFVQTWLFTYGPC